MYVVSTFNSYIDIILHSSSQKKNFYGPPPPPQENLLVSWWILKCLFCFHHHHRENHLVLWLISNIFGPPPPPKENLLVSSWILLIRSYTIYIFLLYLKIFSESCGLLVKIFHFFLNNSHPTPPQDFLAVSLWMLLLKLYKIYLFLLYLKIFFESCGLLVNFLNKFI